jgi:hemerythrin-like metal-binding protein
MSLITWSESLSVGIKQIDLQHQKLIDMINDFNSAMLRRESQLVMEKIVDDLFDYTGSHFHLEERLFQKYNYPDAVEHLKEHKAFFKNIWDFKVNLTLGKAVVSEEIMQFLSDWLRNHIMGTDKKYSQFFNHQGLN